MVQATAAVIPIVKQAAAMPQCQFPVDWGAGWKATFPHYIPMRNLGKLLLAHALIAADEGRPQDAVDLVSLSLKVAKATRNEPTMISTLLLTSQTRNANRALQEIMRRCNLTNSQLDEVNNTLNDTDYQREMLNGLKGDRASILQLYNSIISQGAAAYQELNAKSGDAAKASGAASLRGRPRGAEPDACRCRARHRLPADTLVSLHLPGSLPGPRPERPVITVDRRKRGAARLISAKPGQTKPAPSRCSGPWRNGRCPCPQSHVDAAWQPGFEPLSQEIPAAFFIGDQIPNKKPPICSFVIFRTDSQYMHQRNPA